MYGSEEVINIRYSDIDFDKSLKMFSLLNFFQDIASENAEKHGFGYSCIYPQKLMWVLLKYRIEFEQYPSDVHKYILKTEPRGYNRLFAYRNFELCADDKTVARASSMWALVNIETMEMVNIENVLESNPVMSKFVPAENDLKFNKIPQILNIDYEEEFKVRYNDIDVNMHANNANYIIWALEPLPYEFKVSHKLKNIDINFKKEIKYGEHLLSKVQVLDGCKTVHVLKNSKTQEDLCTIMCEWI